MFGYDRKSFFRTWIVALLLLVIGAVAYASYNSITHTFDFSAGIGAIGDMLGGLTSLFGLVVGIAVIAAVVWAVHFFTKTHYEDEKKRRSHVAIGSALIIVAVFVMASAVANQWIKLDDSFWINVGIFLGAIVIVTAATAVILPRAKKVDNVRAVSPIAKTTANAS